MKKYFDELYAEFNNKSRIKSDPVQFVYHYSRLEDCELAGLIASSLAYGRVEKILQSVSAVLTPLGDQPAEYLKKTHMEFENIYIGFKHRLNTGDDIALLLYALRLTLIEYKTLFHLFETQYSKYENIKDALAGFSDKIRNNILISATEKKINIGRSLYLLPTPKDNSPCKRLNLFLKWMIRKDAVDPGIWSGRLGNLKNKLIIPLDAHILRCARNYSMTARKTNDWKTAVEITEFLKKINADDPLKYDFAICHSGIQTVRQPINQPKKSIYFSECASKTITHNK